MALFSYSLHSYNRKDGHKVVDKVAYILGTAIRDELYKDTPDYSTKQDNVLVAGVLLPDGSPVKLRQAPVLANRMEAAEPRINSKVCRQAIIALQWEFTLEENLACLMEMSRRKIERYGCGIIWAIHGASAEEGHDERNIHAHLITTRREITPDGLNPKNRSFDALDHKMTSAAELDWQRRTWMEIVNAMFERKNLAIRISCETLAAQGIERIPQIHVGTTSRAMEDQGKPHDSVVRYDFRGREINWPEIDQGRSRTGLNGNIAALNLERDAFGPQPLSEQIHDLEKLIEILIERITNLGAVIPEGMLPPWARRMLHAMQAIMERIILQKIEAEAAAEHRQEEKKRREGLHEQMRRMEAELKEMKEALARRKALEGFYLRLQLTVASMPPIRCDIEPPRRVISNAQYNVELHFKAETARAQVPPEYRPRIERPSVSLPDIKTGQGAFTAAVTRPRDNGGLAKMPPPLTTNFNAQADPPSYKQKVKVGFGLG